VLASYHLDLSPSIWKQNFAVWGWLTCPDALPVRQPLSKGSDTLESFLLKVAFGSNLQKKLSRTEHVLIVKVSFERRKIAKVFMTHVQVFFRKSLSKATFKRKTF